MKKLMLFVIPQKIHLRLALGVIVFVFGLSGCVSIAKTADEMIVNNYAHREMCSQHSREEVARYIKEKLEYCSEWSYSNGLLHQVDVWVETSALEDGTQRVSMVMKANWNKSHMQLVEVRETVECPAHVKVYGMNDIKVWFSKSEKILSWITAWNAEC